MQFTRECDVYTEDIKDSHFLTGGVLDRFCRRIATLSNVSLIETNINAVVNIKHNQECHRLPTVIIRELV